MSIQATDTRSTFSIITPCYNAERYIAETVNSVVNNTAVVSKDVNLDYIICDGGSRDDTTNIIREIFSDIKADNISTTLRSEKDLGMYDALAKGLRLAKGDICGYINAGDFYAPTAFATVLEIFQQNPIKWLTGYSVTYNEKSQIVRVELPYKYRRRLIQRGLYGTRLPYIQQESTFWNSKLNGLLDYNRLAQFKYAGDYYIWKTLSQEAELHIAEAWLGGFKKHAGQLSENIQEYLSELRAIAEKPNVFDYLVAKIDYFLWHQHASFKKIFNNRMIFRFDHEKQRFV